jgi:hypothetical protein
MVIPPPAVYLEAVVEVEYGVQLVMVQKVL